MLQVCHVAFENKKNHEKNTVFINSALLHFFCLLYVVCLGPPTAPEYSQTTPTDISGQFLAGDTIEYSCNGDLTPDESTTITCEDSGLEMAVWSESQISNCCRLIMTYGKLKI